MRPFKNEKKKIGKTKSDLSTNKRAKEKPPALVKMMLKKRKTIKSGEKLPNKHTKCAGGFQTRPSFLLLAGNHLVL